MDHSHPDTSHPVAAPESSREPSSTNAPDANKPADDAPPAVRFSSAIEEISPSVTVQQHSSSDKPGPSPLHNELGSGDNDNQQVASKSFQGTGLQERRMNTYQFEAFSLPPSRVPSREDESPDSTRLHTPSSSGFHSPHGSPRISALASPPLTPAGSGSADQKPRDVRFAGATGSESQITPFSSAQDKSPGLAERRPLTHRPKSTDHVLRRSSSAEEHLADIRSHRRGMFSSGGSSVPVSRESSPSRSSASHFYSKPATPVGDLNDPYAKGRRPPQQPHPNRSSIDPRFVFSRKKKHGSPGGSRSSLAGSGAFDKKNGDDSSDGGHSHHGHHGAHGSMVDLKRFFRKSGQHTKKREASPAPAKPQVKTPPSSRSSHQVPFADDHGLSSKYGKLGKVLGSGAGGSVRLMRRKEDNTVFAVKEFRARHAHESEKEYTKKVTAEFCVGSTLHHGNIIETLDILQERGRWFEVMEYAPFDLFAIVMTGKMSRQEVSCCFLQILNGVTYLHSVGLAHRDLKLDNVVVSDKGIMKIIDFGSAHVFKYPFETDPVPAKGIVGSDPYLAPEVYDSKEYDAAAVDIWSLAIIFCCMSLRRFPWKIPRMTDNSYKLFASEPTPGHDPDKMIVSSKSSGTLSALSTREVEENIKEKEREKEKEQEKEREKQREKEKEKEQEHEKEKEKEKDNHHHFGFHRHHDNNKQDNKHDGHKEAAAPAAAPPAEKKEIIRGPWRILRLLPRESRHIIHRMLDLNPKTRAKMDEILMEPWVADTVICQQLEDGDVLAAEDHTHVLEPPNNPPQ